MVAPLIDAADYSFMPMFYVCAWLKKNIKFSYAIILQLLQKTAAHLLNTARLVYSEVAVWFRACFFDATLDLFFFFVRHARLLVHIYLYACFIDERVKYFFRRLFTFFRHVAAFLYVVDCYFSYFSFQVFSWLRSLLYFSTSSSDFWSLILFLLLVFVGFFFSFCFF